MFWWRYWQRKAQHSFGGTNLAAVVGGDTIVAAAARAEKYPCIVPMRQVNGKHVCQKLGGLGLPPLRGRRFFPRLRTATQHEPPFRLMSFGGASQSILYSQSDICLAKVSPYKLSEYLQCYQWSHEKLRDPRPVSLSKSDDEERE